MIARALNWLYDHVDGLKQRQVDRAYREDQMGPMLARETQLMVAERQAAAPAVEAERRRIIRLIGLGYARNELARRRLWRWAKAGKIPTGATGVPLALRPGPSD